MSLLAGGVFLCLSGWVSVYMYLCNTNGSRGYEWNCRLVTLLHGILACSFTAYIGYIDGPWPFTHPGTKNTPLQTFTMMLSLGYFLFDMAWCVHFRTEGPVMLLHHTISILGILLVLWLGESGIEGCSVLFGTEITNPILQTRWFLRETGRHETWLGDAVDVAFVVLFVFMRVFVGGWMLHCELSSPRPTLVVKCGGVALYAMSWVFMVDIVNFTVRKTKKKHLRWKERHSQPAAAAVNGLKAKAD